MTINKCLTLILACHSLPVVANVFFAPSMKVGVFSFRTLEEEDTENFYVTGPELSFGYMYKGIFEIGPFVNYLPGNAKSFGFFSDNASLLNYGLQTGFYFAEAVYLGLKGSSGNYSYKSGLTVSENPVKGSWQTTAIGAELAAINYIDKKNIFRFSFEYMHYAASGAQQNTPSSRNLDHVCFALTYVFNDRFNRIFRSTFLKKLF